MTETGNDKNAEVKTTPVKPNVVDRTIKGVPIQVWDKMVDRAKRKNTGKVWRYLNYLMDIEEIMEGWLQMKREAMAAFQVLAKRIDALEKKIEAKPNREKPVGFGKKTR